MLNKLNKLNIIKKFTKNIKNTGSSEVQIAILTFRIIYLNSHFQNNKKDLHSRKGLISLINKRKKLLKYLKKKNYINYLSLIKKLKIRK